MNEGLVTIKIKDQTIMQMNVWSLLRSAMQNSNVPTVDVTVDAKAITLFLDGVEIPSPEWWNDAT